MQSILPLLCIVTLMALLNSHIISILLPTSTCMTGASLAFLIFGVVGGNINWFLVIAESLLPSTLLKHFAHHLPKHEVGLINTGVIHA
jgi:hypothetical protein